MCTYVFSSRIEHVGYVVENQTNMTITKGSGVVLLLVQNSYNCCVFPKCLVSAANAFKVVHSQTNMTFRKGSRVV